MQLKIKQLLLVSLLGMGAAVTSTSKIGVHQESSEYSYGSSGLFSRVEVESDSIKTRKAPTIIVQAVNDDDIILDNSRIVSSLTVPADATKADILTLLGDSKIDTSLAGQFEQGKTYSAIYKRVDGRWTMGEDSVVESQRMFGVAGVPAIEQAKRFIALYALSREALIPTAPLAAVNAAANVYGPILKFSSDTLAPVAPTAGANRLSLMFATAATAGAAATHPVYTATNFGEFATAILSDADIIEYNNLNGILRLSQSKNAVKDLIRATLHQIGLTESEISNCLKLTTFATSAPGAGADAISYNIANINGVPAELLTRAEALYGELIKLVPGLTPTGAPANAVAVDTPVDLSEFFASAMIEEAAADSAEFKAFGPCWTVRKDSGAAKPGYLWDNITAPNATLRDVRTSSTEVQGLSMADALSLGSTNAKITYFGKTATADIKKFDPLTHGTTKLEGKITIAAEASPFVNTPQEQQLALKAQVEVLKNAASDFGVVIVNADGSIANAATKLSENGTQATYALTGDQLAIIKSDGKLMIYKINPNVAGLSYVVVSYKDNTRKEITAIAQTSLVDMAGNLIKGIQDTAAASLGQTGTPSLSADLTLADYLKTRTPAMTQEQYNALPAVEQKKVDVDFANAALAQANAIASLTPEQKNLLNAINKSNMSEEVKQFLRASVLSPVGTPDSTAVVPTTMEAALAALGPKVVGELNALKDSVLFTSATAAQIVAELKKTSTGASLDDDKLTAAATAAIKARDAATADVTAKKQAEIDKATEANKNIAMNDVFRGMVNNAGIAIPVVKTAFDSAATKQKDNIMNMLMQKLGVTADRALIPAGVTAESFISQNLASIGFAQPGSVQPPVQPGATPVAPKGAQAGTKDPSIGSLNQNQLDAGIRLVNNRPVRNTNLAVTAAAAA